VGRELHVSNTIKVNTFYSELLGWHIEQETYSYEYWVTIFGVKDINVTRQKILAAGGHLVSDEGKRILFTDCFEEAFFYIHGIGGYGY
jgi:predicted enzyme related to lactoylglutathione lyase